MNSTKVSSADNRYSIKPFFGFTLKNNWQHFALYLIIMLLATVLPCVMIITEQLEHADIITDWKYILGDVTVFTGICGVVASLVIAVFSGMSAASYVNSKQQVGCWHSFPLRREGLFLVETSVRAIYYLAAYLPCAIAAWIFINISLPMTAYFNIVYLKHILAAILCYLLLYSVILFAGGLTGTAPVRLIMTALILGLPIALYALLLVCASIGIPQLSEDYYLSENVLRVLCSTYRIGEAVARIDSSIYPEHFAYILWAIPETILFYGGALLLHKHRKSEFSGTTIIWKPVFVITKYITIFTAALLGIAIFGSGFISGDSGNAAWTIFGLIFGLVISSMVINAILYRSSKAIFKGLRGLAAVAAAAVLVMLILPLDVFDLSHKIYDASNTKTITIDRVEFGKDADLDTLISLLRNEKISEEGFTPADYDESQYVYLWNDTGSREELIEEFYYTIFSGKEEAENAWNTEENYMKEPYDFHYDSSSYIDIIQKPKFGIPLAKRVYINMNGDFWDTMARSAEYKEYQERILQVQEDTLTGLNIQFGGFSEYIDFYEFHENMGEFVTVRAAAEEPVAMTSEGYSSYNKKEIRDIFMEILPYFTYDSTNRDNSVILGNIEVSSHNSDGIYINGIYPVYADNIEVVNGVCRMLNSIYINDKNYVSYPEFTDEAEYYDHYIDTYCRAIAIIDRETGEIRRMSPEQFRDIAPSMAYLRERGYSSVDEHMRVYNGKYWITASFKDPFAPEKEEYHHNRTLYLREGAVTDEILAEIFNLCK